MKISENISLWIRKLRNIFFFILGISVIVLLFPKEGKFRYEFQKGKPWMHELLVAPFDFPIYKSDDVVKSELDSLLIDFQPFFRLDTTIAYKVKENFGREIFPGIWKSYLGKIIEGGVDTSRNSVKDNLGRIKQYYQTEIWKIAEEVYNRGIVEDPVVLENIVNQDKLISVISGQIVEDRQASAVFTLKTAYEFFRNAMIGLKTEGVDNNLVISLIDPMEILSYNLFYDEPTSEKMRNSYQAELSLTSGMVQAGEKVIALGEPVNEDQYLILQSLKREYETNPGVKRNLTVIVIGQVILASLVYLVFYLFLLGFRSEILKDGRKVFFLVFLLSIMFFLAALTIKSETLNIYVIPFVLIPIIVKSFYDARTAIFIHFLSVLVIGFWAPNGFEFVFMNFIAGVVAVFSLRTVYKRGTLFVTAMLTLLSYCLVYTGVGIIQEGNLESFNWIMFAWFSGNALLILTSYPLIYIFEKTFGFLSDATLVELSDTNHKLLRKLAEKAPGTFQHSLQVSNLAEEAALKLGADSLLIRAGALYHDIGKMDDPMFFIENLSSGYNPHDNLEFEASAEKIIGHVSKGAEIARKKNLPSIIIDFILTHHGTTTVQYFYKSFLKKYPDAEIDLAKFTYPGPKPKTKEQSILMMADSVEAASRSLKEVNQIIIEELVEKIIGHQWSEKQFEYSDLTLKEITIVKEVFKKRLLNIYHARIEYPK